MQGIGQWRWRHAAGLRVRGQSLEVPIWAWGPPYNVLPHLGALRPASPPVNKDAGCQGFFDKTREPLNVVSAVYFELL